MSKSAYFVVFIWLVSVNVMIGDVWAQDLGTIMPTGDSITDGQESTDGLGYRNDLAELLDEAGYAFSYVGDTGYDPYWGHFYGGIWIEDYYPSWFGNGWGTGNFDTGPALDQYHPEVILIHLGTNNMAALQPGDPVGPYSLDGGTTFLHNPSGVMAELILFIISRYDGYPDDVPFVVLSQIIPREDYLDRVVQFNGYLAELAQDLASGLVTGYPVHVVLCDHFTPFMENPLIFTGLAGDYMADSVHPNDLGYHVMAETYFESLMDQTPPAPVADLTVWGVGPHTVKLWYTTPGDDYFSGTATTVSFRVFDEAIDGFDQFDAAWELLPPFQPGSGGNIEQVIAGGLPSGRAFWVAVVAEDEAGNVSEVSNSPFFQTEGADSLRDSFGGSLDPVVWDAGSDYQVSNGELKPANQLPTFLAPALFTGEPGPYSAEIRLSDLAAPGETDLMGLVVMMDTPDRYGDGYAIQGSGEDVVLRTVSGGILGQTVDSRTSAFGRLGPGDRLGAIPFILKGKIAVRILRNGMPDRVLSTGVPAISIPEVRYAGVFMRGGLGWGVDDFRLEGPGLWEAPDAFHLISPDSGLIVDNPPVLIWEQSVDPDPWDRIIYSVTWSTDPEFSPGETSIIECGGDTSVIFPESDYMNGTTYYWFVHATDSTGLETISTERGWWFASDDNRPPRPFALLSPGIGDTVDTKTPMLRWTASSDPDGDSVAYTVILSDDADLGHVFHAVSGLQDTTFQTPDLPSVGPWYWSVTARDGQGAETIADTSYFFVDEAAGGELPVRPVVFVTHPSPNPARESITLTMAISISCPARIRLFDLAGRCVLDRTDVLPAGKSRLVVPIPASVSDGSYILVVRANGIRENFPIMVRR